MHHPDPVGPDRTGRDRVLLQFNVPPASQPVTVVHGRAALLLAIVRDHTWPLKHSADHEMGLATGQAGRQRPATPNDGRTQSVRGCCLCVGIIVVARLNEEPASSVMWRCDGAAELRPMVLGAECITKICINWNSWRRFRALHASHRHRRLCRHRPNFQGTEYKAIILMMMAKRNRRESNILVACALMAVSSGKHFWLILCRSMNVWTSSGFYRNVGASITNSRLRSEYCDEERFCRRNSYCY